MGITYNINDDECPGINGQAILAIQLSNIEGIIMCYSDDHLKQEFHIMCNYIKLLVYAKYGCCPAITN